jgi:hypothetical protein
MNASPNDARSVATAVADVAVSASTRFLVETGQIRCDEVDRVVARFRICKRLGHARESAIGEHLFGAWRRITHFAETGDEPVLVEYPDSAPPTPTISIRRPRRKRREKRGEVSESDTCAR